MGSALDDRRRGIVPALFTISTIVSIAAAFGGDLWILCVTSACVAAACLWLSKNRAVLLATLFGFVSIRLLIGVILTGDMVMILLLFCSSATALFFARQQRATPQHED
jgi:hypothetical protein